MVTVRQVEKKDQKRWNNYVLSHPEASPYHLWAWKDSVEQAYGHTSFYLVAEYNEKVVGVFPLFNLRFPWLLNELTALPFCDVGNCLADSFAIQNALVNQAKAVVDEKLCNKSSLRGSMENVDGLSESLHINEGGKVRMCLSLPGSAEILLASFKSKLRSQIRKAEKNGVQFQWKGQEGVNDFYTVYSQNMRDLGSPPHSKKWFNSIMVNYGERGRIGLAIYDGKCIGAGLILSTSLVTAIPWASTLREFNYLSPNMLLYWNFLKYSSGGAFKFFDFGRSTEGEGTYKFKKQWGAKAQPLQWYSFHGESSNDVENKPQNNEGTSRHVVASLWKKLPLPASNYIGPKLRKYISL
ncbi:GNAT family N-acetyltransferase [Desulforhopalus sp. 52FAK]